MFKVVLTYNYKTDETKLKTSKNWEGLPNIHRLDALQDGEGLVQELYAKTLKEFGTCNKKQNENAN